MIYQLRFSEELKLDLWLKQAAQEIEKLFSPDSWNPPQPLGVRLILLKKALRDGLLGMVRTSDLCGLQAECDEGCSPAEENTAPDRFDKAKVNAPVERYSLADLRGLPEIAETLATAMRRHVPQLGSGWEKLGPKLAESLAPHLYQNELCGSTDGCTHSQAVDLKVRLSRKSEV